MSGFSIDVNSANQIASTLRQENDDLMRQMKNLEQASQDTVATWAGQVTAAYASAKAMWDEGMNKMQQGLDQATVILNQNSNSYVTTDEEMAGLFQRR